MSAKTNKIRLLGPHTASKPFHHSIMIDTLGFFELLFYHHTHQPGLAIKSQIRDMPIDNTYVFITLFAITCPTYLPPGT